MKELFSNIEINELKEDRKRGRLNITITALSIHERGQWNKRGMTWLEEYVNANIESAIGMPIVVSWLIDKEIPSDHGAYGFDEDGNRFFYDSDTVGSVQKAWIQDVEIKGIKGKKMVCKGYIYSQRYPKFCKWIREQIADSEHIEGSVEVDGKGDSQEIIYESGNGHNPDGSWEMGRIPKIFDFTGLCILCPHIFKPADDGSEIIEINSLDNSQNQSGNTDDINTKKEDSKMAEINTDSVVELNNKIVAQATEINNLQHQITEKDAEINRCKEELNTYKEKEAELNKCKEDLSASKEKETELNSLLVEANKTVESQKTQIAELNSEIEPLRQMKADTDAKNAQAEVDAYFETIKKENGFSEAELNSLKTDYVDKCDLAGLKEKETELCVNKFKEMKRLDTVNAELNSDSAQANALFFSTKMDNTEINNIADDGSDLFK